VEKGTKKDEYKLPKDEAEMEESSTDAEQLQKKT